MNNCFQQQAACAATSEAHLRIQIVSDIRFLRESLAAALAREGALEVVGAFANTEDALSYSALATPDIILLDEALPNGLSAVARIRQVAPTILPVVIAVTEVPEQVIAWGEAGVAGYIPRTCGVAEIFPLLVDIRRGQQACSAGVATALLRRLAVLRTQVDGTDEVPGVPALTAREQQIGQMIAAGMSDKDIARRLNIGVTTTKTHVHHLLGKLKVQRRAQAANWMREHKRQFP
jgi:DNA-binding NarL/FixJ family response regulator